MFELPEERTDFVHKYKDTVGIITYRPRIQKTDISIPCHIHGISANSLVFNVPSKYKNEEGIPQGYKWVPRQVALSSIKDIDFNIPDLGYVQAPGKWPVFMSRAFVRSVRRGYNNTSIAAITPEILRSISSATIAGRKRNVSGPTDPNVVMELMGKERKYTPIHSIQQDKDLVVVIGRDFLALASPKIWWLLYQNYVIGTLFPRVDIHMDLSGIVDAYNDQVR